MSQCILDKNIIVKSYKKINDYYNLIKKLDKCREYIFLCVFMIGK